MSVRVTDRTQQFMNRVAARLLPAVTAGRLAIETQAKINCPVRTGTLRRSINTQAEMQGQLKAVAHIGPNTNYAPYVEFGTRRMSPRPYLRPAFESRKGEAIETIRAALRT